MKTKVGVVRILLCRRRVDSVAWLGRSLISFFELLPLKNIFGLFFFDSTQIHVCVLTCPLLSVTEKIGEKKYTDEN